jgi:hypothetical protein
MPHQPDLFEPERRPSFLVAGGGRRGSERSVPALVLIAVLALLGQLALAWYRGLLVDPRLDAWLLSLCERVGCAPPPRALPGAFNLLGRDVRRHPDVEDALLITLTLANRAGFPAAAPVIEVRLTDLSDRPIALRRFRPEEYLSDEEVLRRGVAPGSLLPVAIEVEDPGRGALAFQFAFH